MRFLKGPKSARIYRQILAGPISQKLCRELVKLVQSIYLTLRLYLSNGLYESAAASALGFIFSFVPVLMLLWVFMLGLLRADPRMMLSIESLLYRYRTLFSTDAILNYILSVRSLSPSTIFIMVFLVWMSHKFFSSVMSGFVRIFRTVVPPRTIKNYILSFAGALFTVLLLSSGLFLVFILKEVLSLAIFSSIEVSSAVPILVNLAFYLTILVASIVTFRVYSGTRPSWHLCSLCAIACAIGFWGFKLCIRLFYNMANYNIVYGVLSDLIILSIEVDVFFIMFMYFAQFIYVRQHFSLHFLEELYLLQSVHTKGTIARWRHRLFTAYSSQAYKLESYEAGDYIYKVGDGSPLAYCVLKGVVSLSLPYGNISLKAGSFFGEKECLFRLKRAHCAIASSPVTLLKVSNLSLKQLVKVNPTIALELLHP